MKAAFWSGFVSSGFSVGTEGYGGKPGRTMIMATVGGTVSEITGGKFANGAVSGAFVHLFNAEWKNMWENTKKFSSRVWSRAEKNYNTVMDSLTGKILKSGSTSIVIYNENKNFRGIFHKPYMSTGEWIFSGFKTTSMGFVDTAIFRVLEPIVVGQIAFATGVAIGSIGVGIYEELTDD